jgi:hypothetical protein
MRNARAEVAMRSFFTGLSIDSGHPSVPAFNPTAPELGENEGHPGSTAAGRAAKCEVEPVQQLR